MRILLTRPQDEAERSAETLRALGHEPLIAPVLRIEAMPQADLGEGPFAALLMTSGNAARILQDHPRRAELLRLPVFAVGQKTAQAAQRAGCADVVSADGDSADLLRLIAARLPETSLPLLYLAGSDISRDLGSALSARGLKVRTVVVYRARAATALSEAAELALKAHSVNAALHYSRRSSAIFIECARAAGLLPEINALIHVCLSERAAEPLRQAGARDIRIAARRDEAALIECL